MRFAMRERTVPLELNCNTAEAALAWAGQRNPGNWIGHSRFVALACKNIAAKCNNMDADQAYCFGLLHDIGRYAFRDIDQAERTIFIIYRLVHPVLLEYIIFVICF